MRAIYHGAGIAALTVAAMLTAVSPAAPAADANGDFATLGGGSVSCAQFLKVRAVKSNEYFLLGGWVDGYLTARNEFDPDTYALTPWQSLEFLAGSLANWCKQNPDKPFLQAVASMAAALKPQRLTGKSERVQITVGGVRQDFFVETIRRIQQALAKAGFFSGAVDGKFGRDTSVALRDFQAKYGISVSGFPDQLTLFRLFYSPANK